MLKKLVQTPCENIVSCSTVHFESWNWKLNIKLKLMRAVLYWEWTSQWATPVYSWCWPMEFWLCSDHVYCSGPLSHCYCFVTIPFLAEPLQVWDGGSGETVVCRVSCILWIYHRGYRLSYVSLGECVCVCVCVCVGAVSEDIVYVVGGKGKGMVYCTGIWLAVVSDKDKVCSLVNKMLLCNFSVWIACLFCSCSRFPLTNKLTRWAHARAHTHTQSLIENIQLPYSL